MALSRGNIHDVIDSLNYNKNHDCFNCIAITGKVRMGKSRLAKIITTGVFPEFTYEGNYIGNPKHGQSFRTLFDSPHKSACWIDEGEKILSSEARMEKLQWWLQQLFNQFASHNKTVIICTPSFRKIDKRWRDTHITIWIHVYKRGCAVLLKNRDSVATEDIWGLKEMKGAEENAKADDLRDEKILKIFDKNPCALLYFDYPDWDTEEEKNEYLSWKEKSQKDLRIEFDKWDRVNDFSEGTKAEQFAARLVTYLKYKYQIPYNELSYLGGISKDLLTKYIQAYEDKISDGKIQEEDLPKKYFDDAYMIWIKQEIELRKTL